MVSQVFDPNDDPVARAEAALVQLSSEFSSWVQSECERLEAAKIGIVRTEWMAGALGALAALKAAAQTRGGAARLGSDATCAVAVGTVGRRATTS